MGIEPTWDPYEPHTGFEDQGHHQAPVTSDDPNGPTSSVSDCTRPVQTSVHILT